MNYVAVVYVCIHKHPFWKYCNLAPNETGIKKSVTKNLKKEKKTFVLLRFTFN